MEIERFYVMFSGWGVKRFGREYHRFDVILVEQFPKLEGRQMVMMIAPGRKKPAGAAKAATERAAAVATSESGSEA